MPALYLFNRRTLLAGDDLHLPSIVWGAVSTVQLFIFVPFLLYYTIDLLLTTTAHDDDDDNVNYSYDNDGVYNNDNNSNIDWMDRDSSSEWETINLRRRLSNQDIYIEFNLPSMQSQYCSNATSTYTNYNFPIFILIYLIGMSIYTSVSIWYEQRIYYTSSIGTPTLNIQLRNGPLKNLMEFKMTYLSGYNAILLVFGLCITFVYIGGEYRQCFPTIWWIGWFILFVTQGVQCFVMGTTLFALWRVQPVISSTTIVTGEHQLHQQHQQHQSDFYQRHLDNGAHHAETAEELWQNRCQGCCQILAISTCFCFGGRGIVSHAAEGGGEKFYGDIARALADYFADFGNNGSGDNGSGAIATGLDVVPSDVGLGFVMLRHIQAQRKMLARRDALQQMGMGTYYGSNNDLPSLVMAASSPSNRNDTTLLFRRSSTAQSDEHQQQQSTNDQLEDESSSPDNHPPPPITQSQSAEEEPYTSFSRKVLSQSNPDDYTLIEEGARFARHQLAIYTWILYYYQFPVSGTFRLLGRSLKAKTKCSSNDRSTTDATGSSGGRRQSSNYEPCSLDVELGEEGSSTRLSPIVDMNQETIVGDNFLRIHEATMLAHAGLDAADIAYANFEAGFYETPYCIIIDRKWKSVVLSIRGSLTLEDCVVDVLLDPIPLDALGEKYGFDGSGQYCHGGVLECSNWLYEDLMRHKILQSLLLGENAEYPDYTLRIVGHSLGAGIGVILSYMLRNTFPNLRCLCYSPPGGLLSWDLAKECSEFVNSFVLDSDIVPRLSLNNMER